MIKRYRIYLLICTLGLSAASCKKDEVRTVAGDGTPTTMQASATTLVLSKPNAGEPAVTFRWNASTFGFSGVVKYSVEFAKKGTGFAVVKAVAADTLMKTLTVGELNTIANGLELDNGIPQEMEVRINAYISRDYPAAFSNVTGLVVTSYMDLIDYPSLWVPGDYQGWAPATAAKLASLKSDEVYEGFVHFPGAATSFKLTTLPSWDGKNYGGTSAGNGGAVSTSGDNLAVSGAGYYFLQVDLGGSAWTATNTTWSLIGNAAGGWDTDVDMTFDAAKNAWTATLNLTAGALKFRANHAYDINFGDNKLSDPFLNRGGKDIPVAEAGSYVVTLDLSRAGNYMYSIVKK
ncbi:SusE domain-containing protein [Chitinophaga sp.]|uniref:SusE domain-containing protein n=1 Tax=Chitinophaga sp. TaxID=1869181 RepID=UPI002623AEC5|nr:SusE domain-containing protein [uncultured Chitinophaga sp.]